MKTMHLILAFVACLLGRRVWGGEPVDINTADVNILEEMMVSVGLALSMAIVEYRAAFSVFASVYEVVKFKGIGGALMEKIEI